MSNRNRNILIALGVLAIMVISRLLPFTRLPSIPPISLAPEVLFRIGPFPFTNSLLMTLLVDLVLIALVLLGVGRMRTVPRGLQNVLEVAVEMLHGLGESIDRRHIRRFFTLAASIFFFVFFSNLLALVPGVGAIGQCMTHEAAALAPVHEETVPAQPEVHEPAPGGDAEHAGEEGAAAAGTICGTDAEGHELVLVPYFRAPSADLNMTLALALIVFVATQYNGFRALGLGYLGKFFNIRAGLIGFIVGIVELLSEFVRIISFMFRLFGNIFAGEVVLLVMAFLVPWFLPSIFYGYELFVAFIQAFIFCVLAMVFISLAMEAHGEHDHHGAAHAGHEEEAVTTADSRQQATL